MIVTGRSVVAFLLTSPGGLTESSVGRSVSGLARGEELAKE